MHHSFIMLYLLPIDLIWRRDRYLHRSMLLPIKLMFQPDDGISHLHIGSLSIVRIEIYLIDQCSYFIGKMHVDFLQ